MDKEIKHALHMSIAQTVAAVFAVMVILFRDTRPIQIVFAGALTLNAAIWWIHYAKKQQEEQDHE